MDLIMYRGLLRISIGIPTISLMSSATINGRLTVRLIRCENQANLVGSRASVNNRLRMLRRNRIHVRYAISNITIMIIPIGVHLLGDVKLLRSEAYSSMLYASAMIVCVPTVLILRCVTYAIARVRQVSENST